MYPNLKAEMARKGITQTKLAEFAGVSTRTIYSWLNETPETDVSMAIAIKNRFFPKQEVDYLFTYESPK